MSILSVSKLIKRYGGLLATDHFDVDVGSGELHALIGPNGAGKSTLIGQLSGELQSDSGRITFEGEDITRKSVVYRARKGLARSYQITSIFPEFTVLENAVLAVQVHRGHSFRFWRAAVDDPGVVERAYVILEQCGLGSRTGVTVSEMAHGERRQLELAMALAGNPKLLLLDEPMAGMSQAESEQMTKLLLSLKGRYAMLLVEHDMDAVFALADRITVLVYGKVIACGTSPEIRENEKVREAYLGESADLLLGGS